MKSQKIKNIFQENKIMKNVTFCLLTVLFTYSSLCAISYTSLLFLMNSDAGDFLTFISAIIISAVTSSVGMRLGKKQKSIWLSFVLTVLTAWLLPHLLYFILDNYPGFSTQITQTVNIISVVLGYPGLCFGIASGEHGITISAFTHVVFLVICGIIPCAITVISAKIKKAYYD